MSLTFFPQIQSNLIQKLGVLYPRDGPVWRHSFGKLPLESAGKPKIKISIFYFYIF